MKTIPYHPNLPATVLEHSFTLVPGSFIIVRHYQTSAIRAHIFFISLLHEENDEPGIMKPGHCFTIEVCKRLSHCQNAILTFRIHSPPSCKAGTLEAGFSQMNGQLPLKWVAFLVGSPRGHGANMVLQNCARSAQSEHMVLITDTGAEVLTE